MKSLVLHFWKRLLGVLKVHLDDVQFQVKNLKVSLIVKEKYFEYLSNEIWSSFSTGDTALHGFKG